jgi:dihydrofolate reductase
MGSKTFKSLPGILPYREHIVLSNTLESDENISVFTSIKHILEYIKEYNKSYLIGGANLINQFVKLNLIDELIITHVDTEIKTYDTILDLNFLDKWSIYSNTKFEKNAVNEYSFSICKYILNKKRFYY